MTEASTIAGEEVLHWERAELEEELARCRMACLELESAHIGAIARRDAAIALQRIDLDQRDASIAELETAQRQRIQEVGVLSRVILEQDKKLELGLSGQSALTLELDALRKELTETKRLREKSVSQNRRLTTLNESMAKAYEAQELDHRRSQHAARAEIAELKNNNNVLRKKARELEIVEKKYALAEKKIVHLRTLIDKLLERQRKIYRSKSWRVTSPLRVFSKNYKSLFSTMIFSRKTRSAIKVDAATTATWVPQNRDNSLNGSK